MSAPLPPREWSRESSRTAASGCADGSRSATGRGSRPCIPSRSKSPSATDGTPKAAIVDAAVKRARSPASRAFAPVFVAYGTARAFKRFCGALWRNAGQRPRMSPTFHPGCKLPLLAALGLALSACSSALLSVGAPPGSLPESPRLAQQQQPVPNQREHQRILAAYNGAYDDPKLEALLNATVAKLVAASERPDVHYRVTILNSAAVNAFALPTGQLYVTRGLIALANDTSELASVLSHEMSHVIARHAAIREDPARKVALVSRVVQDVLSDPETGALALAKSKIALASFSRQQEFEADGMGIGIAVRAGYDPYGATRFLTSMGRNAELKSSASQSH